jgi:alkylated DNA nucleotide flippase Atl1
MIDLTGEVVEIKEGVAVVRVSEAEGEIEKESPEAQTEGERLRNEAVKMDGGEMMD